MKTILIVEDDDSIREILQAFLQLEGYSVNVARNGREALEILEKFDPPCLILLDLMMPIMDGWKFLSEKKQDSHIAAIPVIITSAVSHKVISDDIAGVVKKPMEIDVLLKSVRQLCRSA